MNIVEVYLPVLYESSVISRDHPLPIMTPINGPHGTVVSLREEEREIGSKGREGERGGKKERGGGREGEEGERNEGENQEKRKRKDEMRERKKGRKERNRILES